MKQLPTIDKSYTLFIDRDGVINYEKKESYILNWNEFQFYEDVTSAMKIINDIFGTIVMVTNQKGIGKKLMTIDDLNNIHQNMQHHIASAGGRIDKIYYCTDLEDTSINRKPNVGMAFQAKADFPQIEFSKSFMIGNKLSDMQFGRNAGMHTVYLATTNPEVTYPHADIDCRFNTLMEFAAELKKAT
jgi:histidinol-phosphate phosphatase family protein